TVTGGLLALVFGLTQAGETGWTTPATLGPLLASHAPHKNPDGGAARPSEAVQHVITESDFGVFGVTLLMALDREGGNAGQAHGHLHRWLICAVTPGPRS
ncbi:hypothetical protein, partial [Streptomyces sp. NPDC005167]